jgi:hypothetical protein
MLNNRTLFSLAAAGLFAITVIAADRHGHENRIYASGSNTYVVDSPQKAYKIWKEKKVRGRILILFDTYPHNMGFYSYKMLPQLNQANLVEFSIFENIIRRIYFVVPEMEWSVFRNQKYVRPIREATTITKGLFLYNQSGIPIIAVTPSSLPQIEEKVLVYINTGVFDPVQAQMQLAQKMISSDIIVSFESVKK